MSHCYTTAGWENFFFAELGASAALIGLLFIAISINLAKILALPWLANRGGQGLMLLGMVLLTATCALVPGQPRIALGLEIAGIATLSLIVAVATRVHVSVEGVNKTFVIMRTVADVFAIGPMLVGGISLALGAGGGLYWCFPAVGLAFVAAMSDAWVLLIEIHR